MIERRQIKNFSFFFILIILDVFFEAVLVVSAYILGFNDSSLLALFFNDYVLLFFIVCELLSSRGLIRNFLILLYYACFFIFLMGQKLLVVLQNHGKGYNEYLTFRLTVLTGDSYVTFCLLMYVALLVPFITYKIIESLENTDIEEHDSACYKLGSKSIFFFILTVLFLLALGKNIVQLVQQRRLDYEASYLTNYEIPAILKIGYFLFIGFFFVALSHDLNGTEFAVCAFMFMTVNAVGLFSGHRASIVTSALIVLFYYVKKFLSEKDELKFILVLILLGIAGVLGLSLVGMLRSSSSSGSIMDTFLSFFISTGGSDSVIGNIIVERNRFSHNHFLYILHPIIDMLIGNPISVAVLGLLGINIPRYPQGMQYLNANLSFPHWLSYYVNPELYLKGYGMGSSYIAESYFAGGFVLLVVVSVVIGLFLHSMNNLFRVNSRFVRGLMLVLAYALFMLPRGAIFGCAFDVFYYCISYLLFMLIDDIFCDRKKYL